MEAGSKGGFAQATAGDDDSEHAPKCCGRHGQWQEYLGPVSYAPLPSGTELGSFLNFVVNLRRVLLLMCDGKPQNPIFRVDAQALDACLPKVLCQQCGTVITLRKRRRTDHARCPSCHALVRLELNNGRWQAAEDDRQETGS